MWTLFSIFRCFIHKRFTALQVASFVKKFSVFLVWCGNSRRVFSLCCLNAQAGNFSHSAFFVWRRYLKLLSDIILIMFVFDFFISFPLQLKERNFHTIICHCHDLSRILVIKIPPYSREVNTTIFFCLKYLAKIRGIEWVHEVLYFWNSLICIRHLFHSKST